MDVFLKKQVIFNLTRSSVNICVETKFVNYSREMMILSNYIVPKLTFDGSFNPFITGREEWSHESMNSTPVDIVRSHMDPRLIKARVLV